jgi:hypothetical protein
VGFEILRIPTNFPRTTDLRRANIAILNQFSLIIIKFSSSIIMIHVIMDKVIQFNNIITIMQRYKALQMLS